MQVNSSMVNIKLYDIVDIYWMRDDLWPPSIVTIHIINTIDKDIKNIKFKKSTLLDAGAGTGVIGIYIAKKYNNKIKYVTFMDAYILPLIYTAVNINRNKLKMTPKYELSYGIQDTKEIPKAATNVIYDLIVSNPPYLPHNKDSDDDIVLETIYCSGLLKSIIERGWKIGNTIYFVGSEIIDREINKEIEKLHQSTKKRGIKIEVNIIRKKIIPLRIPEILSQDEYIEYIKPKIIEVKKRIDNAKHRYYQEKYIYKISVKRKPI